MKGVDPCGMYVYQYYCHTNVLSISTNAMQIWYICHTNANLTKIYHRSPQGQLT